MFLLTCLLFITIVFSVASCPCSECNNATVDKSTNISDAKTEEECKQELAYCGNKLSLSEFKRSDAKYSKNKSYCHTLQWCIKKVDNAVMSEAIGQYIVFPVAFVFFFVVIGILTDNAERAGES